MTTHDATRGRSARLFAVRIWSEPHGAGAEYRGSVRDVTTGAFRGFREWTDLVAFMVAGLEDNHRAGDGVREEAHDVDP